eukprot:gene29244-12492_t
MAEDPADLRGTVCDDCVPGVVRVVESEVLRRESASEGGKEDCVMLLSPSSESELGLSPLGVGRFDLLELAWGVRVVRDLVVREVLPRFGDDPSSESDEGESGVTQSSLPPYEADSLRTPSKTPTPPPPTPGTQSSQSASCKAAKSTASLPPPPVTPAVPSPLAPRQVGDFGLSKKITELRKKLRSFPPDEKLGDLDGSSKLRRWRVAVETVLSVQFGQSYGD